MITIVKGNDKIVCTKGTFEEQYKILGYQIASKEKEATKKVASIIDKEEKTEKQENKEENINEQEEISEKYGLNKTNKKGK